MMSTSEAMNLADELETDLILLNPDADPPLTRLVELSKYKYELAKADKNQRKKQRENRCNCPHTPHNPALLPPLCSVSGLYHGSLFKHVLRSQHDENDPEHTSFPRNNLQP